ncbi:MAG: nucleotide sugar dehydrogenase [Thaumarchaeota archaeon]|nr:nucleotide sugar dehydrogenase [Nitrososphaerota archaeon]
MISKHTVGMVGLGYVGLTTAACLASRGIRVVGVDVDQRRVATLSKGIVPIHEEGVDFLIKRALGSGLISFHESYEAIKSCDIVFLTVGTPGLPGGTIDTSYVEAAAGAVGRLLKGRREYPVVVVKSTVTPSTTQERILPILEKESGLKCGEGFGLVTNPEFLREGKAVWDMMHPDAVVLGKVDQRSVRVMKSLYGRVYVKMPPLLVTEAVNAEFVKYGVNSIRAVQLSFINTLANMCSRLGGAKVDEVVRGLLLINHIDKRYSRAGLGFGGSCLPKDTNALISLARSMGVNEGLLSMAVEVNEGQANEAIAMAESLIGSVRSKRIAVLGLAFKAGTDDTRESVGIRVAKSLVSKGAEVTAYDPAYLVEKHKEDSFKLARSVSSCIRGADCCIVTNEWDEFKRLSPRAFKSLMRQPAVVDGRGLYDVKKFTRAKVNVRRIGVGVLPIDLGRRL